MALHSLDHSGGLDLDRPQATDANRVLDEKRTGSGFVSSPQSLLSILPLCPV